MSNKWQPIATAPKDGRDVLLYSKQTEEIEVAHFHTRIHDKTGKWYTDYSCADYGQYEVDYPTHWMPLPEAPET